MKMTDEMMALPEFKECRCGASLRVVPMDLDLPDTNVGITECSYCNVSHFVFTGDLGTIQELEKILAESMQPVNREVHHRGKHANHHH